MTTITVKDNVKHMLYLEKYTKIYTSKSSNQYQVQLLNKNSIVQADQGKYIFDTVSYNENTHVGLKIGVYTLQIPNGHPFKLLNNDNSKIRIISGNENNGHYTGEIQIEVLDDFNMCSYQCLYHGYMGGENRLMFIN